MYSADSLEASREHAHAAIALMEQHGIPPHPANYAIWYAYQSGREPGLRHALDRRIAGRTGAAPGDGGSTAELGALIREIRQESRRVADKTSDLERWLARTGRDIARRQDCTEQTLRGTTADPLTGLASRSRFEAGLAEEVAGLWRSGGALSLVIADIDRFRQFNDRHGRQMGQELLFTLGSAFKDMAARRDIAARYDGDVFAVLRPGAALDQAIALGEELRRCLASCKLVNVETGEDYGTLTLSAGVALYRLGEPAGAFVRRAEQALRQAKRRGRNRVCA